MTILRRLLGPAAPSTADCCGRCRHFDNDSHALERSMPLLRSLGSAAASVRDADGLCLRHDRYIRASALCSDFDRLPALAG